MNKMIVDCIGALLEEKYLGKLCDLEMGDWNDGTYDSYVINYDDTFIYYLREEKKGIILGAINMKYIKNIEEVEKLNYKKINSGKQYLKDYHGINIEYFLNKDVDIYLEDKHIWDGIFGVDTEIFSTCIKKIGQMQFECIARGPIDINMVTKIECAQLYL